MARDLWFKYSVQTLDAKGDPIDDGRGGVSRISLRYQDGEWRSDESIKEDVSFYTQYMIDEIIRRRDREMELDRIAAEPFWKRWLG